MLLDIILTIVLTILFVSEFRNTLSINLNQMIVKSTTKTTSCNVNWIFPNTVVSGLNLQTLKQYTYVCASANYFTLSSLDQQTRNKLYKF